MAHYKIVFKRSVAKDIKTIPKKDVQRILKRIETLATDPYPPQAEKLTNDEKYRLRQGNYRILYTVEDAVITVTVVKIGHRRNVYR